MLGQHMTVKVRYEPLRSGLRGEYVHVIDYDTSYVPPAKPGAPAGEPPSRGGYYQTVNLNEPRAMLEQGLDPSESDPRFHQQMVYAVAMETIQTFEEALGRSIRWSFNRDDRKPLLRIFPHAMQSANAYYSPQLGALLFGYFPASADDPGSGLPGQTTFTCLSHDIIAHETTHAVVDAIRDAFMQPTNPDVRAFHEAFADIVALFQHFQFEEVLYDTLQRTGGVLHNPKLKAAAGPASNDGGPVITGDRIEGNPLLGLAQQFGEARGKRQALRSALGKEPTTGDYEASTEAHSRGGVLVAAVFDAFFTSFKRRTADLFRIAGIQAGAGELSAELARRLAGEASKTARHFLNMCIRALDYCPPVDITFGEFLRAVVTSDRELFRSDAHQYRQALIEAFRVRGIRPDSVVSLAEESLLWDRPREMDPQGSDRLGQIKLRFDITDVSNRNDDKNRKIVEEVLRKNLPFFGLCEYEAHGRDTPCTCVVGPEVQLVKSLTTVVRGGERRPAIEYVIEVVRKIERTIPELSDAKMTFFGGSTLVLDTAGLPKYIVRKKLSSSVRLKSQQKFRAAALVEEAGISYGAGLNDEATSLAAVHGEW